MSELDNEKVISQNKRLPSGLGWSGLAKLFTREFTTRDRPLSKPHNLCPLALGGPRNPEIIESRLVLPIPYSRVNSEKNMIFQYRTSIIFLNIDIDRTAYRAVKLDRISGEKQLLNL